MTELKSENFNIWPAVFVILILKSNKIGKCFDTIEDKKKNNPFAVYVL